MCDDYKLLNYNSEKLLIECRALIIESTRKKLSNEEKRNNNFKIKEIEDEILEKIE